MKNKIKVDKPILSVIKGTIMLLPSPSSISYMWNGGSLLGLIFSIQILSGVFLASHYISSLEVAFSSVIHIMREVNMGWVIRFFHMNGASLFFMVMFLHISRGLIFSSYKTKDTWVSGVMIMFVLMGTAFLGYVLPWGQMSFWGATVITNLVSAIPYLGTAIVQWLWGGFSVGEATLNRFFMLHFLMPFILAALLIIHLSALHTTGSNNPQGTNSNKDKIKFSLYFWGKDMMTIVFIILVMLLISSIYPFSMGDPENFNQANPLNTPIHIQPEWYFLFAYAILRSIPNKLGGVLALLMSILILFIFILKKNKKMTMKFNPSKKYMFWMISSSFILLTWAGAKPVEMPYESISLYVGVIYFMLFLSY